MKKRIALSLLVGIIAWYIALVAMYNLTPVNPPMMVAVATLVSVLVTLAMLVGLFGLYKRAWSTFWSKVEYLWDKGVIPLILWLVIVSIVGLFIMFLDNRVLGGAAAFLLTVGLLLSWGTIANFKEDARNAADESLRRWSEYFKQQAQAFETRQKRADDEWQRIRGEWEKLAEQRKQLADRELAVSNMLDEAEEKLKRANNLVDNKQPVEAGQF